VWNLASATNEKSGMDIIASVELKRPGDKAVLVLATSPLENGSSIPNITVDDTSALPMRIRTAYAGSKDDVPVIRVEFTPEGPRYDGTFTVSDAQTYAVMLLDAICAAFDDENLLN
jgi:hypothetical protein